MRAKTTDRTSSLSILTSFAALAPLAAALALLPALAACGDNSGTGGAGASGASGGAGGTGGMGSGGMGGGAAGGPPADPCDYPHDTEVPVTDAAGLAMAIEMATPGTLIRLAPGTYADTFDLNVKGTKEKPIILCGPREAILDTTAQPSSTGIRFQQADFWIVSGFTVTGGRKGLYIETSNDNIVSDLYVHDFGENAIQLRNGASRNTIQYCEIQNTGLVKADAAEGIYIGSAFVANTPPDQCNDTKILWNKFGPGIKTEHIDLKEGTSGAEVRGNTFDGTGILGANNEDSWVVVTGNKNHILENTGTTTPKDGFQVRVVAGAADSGNDNVFELNTATVDSPNFGFFIGPGTTGTVVKCDNKNLGSGMLTNIDCTP